MHAPNERVPFGVGHMAGNKDKSITRTGLDPFDRDEEFIDRKRGYNNVAKDHFKLRVEHFLQPINRVGDAAHLT